MRALLLPILLLAALPAFAAPLTFEEVDTDGDGLISADEAANVEGLDFNAADGDNDGTLSVDEYDIAIESLAPPAEPTPSTTAAKPMESTPPAPVTPPPPAAKPNTGKPTTPANPVTSPAPPKP